MPRKKTDAATEGPKTRTIVRVKEPHQWGALLMKARDQHWRRLEVTVQIRGKLMAGKPAALDAANAMLKARGLEDQIEAVAEIEDPHLRAQAAERIAKDEGLCEFSRRPGKPGLWIPANNIKAGIKENWSVIGLMNEVRGSRKALAEGIFVFGENSWEATGDDRDWVYVGDTPSGIETAVSHTTGPSGPVSAIKRHEYMLGPTLKFDVYIANFASVNEKICDEDFAKMLVHFAEHGLGACRSQGHGRFDVVQVRELEATASTPTPATQAA